MDSLLASLIETAPRAADVYLHILPMDFLRYVLGAGGVYLAVNLALRRRLAERKIRTTSPDWRQMRREIAASIRTVLIFSGAGLAVYYGMQAGFIHVDRSVSAHGWGYFAANAAALVVLHDGWFYWTHRAIHHPRVFRRAHRLHHRSHNPSPWTAYAFNTVEALINAAFLPLALALVPSSEPAIFVFLAHMMLRNAIGHCGYELFPARRDGRPVFDWLTTVTHHDLHHAQAGWNYGLYFTWWDRLMGTEHPLYRDKFAESVRTPLDGSAIAATMRPQTAASGRQKPGVAGRSFRFAEHFPEASALVAAFCLCAALIAGEAARAEDRSGAGAAPLGSLAGVWASEGHGAHVRLRPCDDDPETLCGDLVWAWDGALLEKPHEGPMLAGFRWTGEAWTEGRLLNPDDGRVYRGNITPQADGSLKLKGCALVFCDSQVWRRVEDIPGCAALRTATAGDRPPRAGI